MTVDPSPSPSGRPPAEFLGRSAAVTHAVRPDDTATALGSGTVPVLGTPRLLAWLEEATVRAVADLLDPDHTTVGVEVRLRHLRSSAPGTAVTGDARVESAEGRTLTFAVTASAGGGPLLAEGVVRRAVVDVARFLAPA
ncbi:thioesterase family protein [Pseudonocardia halophobica]|uniref:thioesterase family protein n=1 Tax=Pseudonocardia halophobica TaxID=29401 RepID=UPI003D93DC9C